jgi:hypothetical protein
MSMPQAFREALADLGGPEIFRPPFWRPLCLETELAHILDGPRDGALESLQIGDGWTPALLSLATPGGRSAVWGWVNEPFAICEDNNPLWPAGLSLMPSGVAILRAEDAEDAAEIAAVIRDIADWARVESGAKLFQPMKSRLATAVVSHIPDERRERNHAHLRAARPIQTRQRLTMSDTKKRLSPAQIRVLTNMQNGQPAFCHLRTQSDYGGAGSTALVLRRRGLMTADFEITDAGKAALAAQRAKAEA